MHRSRLLEVSPQRGTASSGHWLCSLLACLLLQGKASELETCHLLNHQTSLGFPLKKKKKTDHIVTQPRLASSLDTYH